MSCSKLHDLSAVGMQPNICSRGNREAGQGEGGDIKLYTHSTAAGLICIYQPPSKSGIKTVQAETRHYFHKIDSTID